VDMGLKIYSFINLVILIILLSVFTFGVLSIPNSHHHEPGCPFMVGERSICPMGTLDHLSAWKSVFSISTSLIIYLAFVIIGLFVFKKDNPPLNFLIIRRLQENEFLFQDLYQELFSRGVLNPKAP